jgi:hypothetical protein
VRVRVEPREKGTMMQEEREQKTATGQSGKKLWEAPVLSYIGDVEDVVQSGSGKVSVTNTDPGEPKKTRPAE